MGYESKVELVVTDQKGKNIDIYYISELYPLICRGIRYPNSDDVHECVVFKHANYNERDFKMELGVINHAEYFLLHDDLNKLLKLSKDNPEYNFDFWFFGEDGENKIIRFRNNDVFKVSVTIIYRKGKEEDISI